MKSVVADYRYRITCLRIVPKVGSTIYLTNYPRDLLIGVNTYLSAAGFDFTGYSSTTTPSPNMIDVAGIAGLIGVDYNVVASGVLDGARCYLFATTWKAPIEDEEPLTASILGKVTFKDENYVIEEMSLVDVLNQSVGKTYTVQCSRTYGDAICGMVLASADNTYTGTITSVSSTSVFTDSGRAEAADFFGAGTVQFTSGQNAGLKAQEVKSFASGVIAVHEAFHYLPAIGDTYTLVRGCRKREVDCQNRVVAGVPYNNILNFFGFTRIPTGSTYAKIGGNE